MKKALLITFLFLWGYSFTSAQTFQNGLSLYEQGDYERAARIFQQSDEPDAILFLGKSYFALNEYGKAIQALNKIPKEAPLEITEDGDYTLALSHLQIKNYNRSLVLLKNLTRRNSSSILFRESLSLYDQILGFLTLRQRRDALREIEDDEIKQDLVDASLGKIRYQSAVSLLNLFVRNTENIDETRLTQITNLLRSKEVYDQRYSPNSQTTLPNGFSYNIGVTLPSFKFEDNEYEISQHLYLGIHLAIEEFNSQNNNVKAFISYRNTESDNIDAEQIVNDLVIDNDVDVIIGPLFSDIADEFADYAEDYEVPIILPLANSDEIDTYNNFLFQLNPTFATQGEIMARYAVQELGYDTLGVIVEKGSLGAKSARAFLREAERNDAIVRYYFEEDLEESGYDIREYSQYFTTDTLDSVDIVEAIYAPFTGTVAPTLVQSLLTDLEAMRSTVAILGSEEWKGINLEDRRLSETEVYFSESFNIDTSTIRANEFSSSFRLRFNTQPNQFAYIGYDAAKLILETLKRIKNPAYLREALRNVNNYEGLSTKVSFRGTHVNQEIQIKRMPRNSELEEFSAGINDQ